MTLEQISNIQRIFNFILANEMGFDYFERFFILTNQKPPNDEETALFKSLVHEYEINENENSDDDSYSYDEEDESYEDDE